MNFKFEIGKTQMAYLKLMRFIDKLQTSNSGESA